jgi:hypothetical protein
MKWLKENWRKIIGFIWVGFCLYASCFFIYDWFKFNGSIREKLLHFFITVIMIFVFLILTADFHDDIIKWFKNTFNK